MTFLQDTNACIGFLRGRNRRLIAQWQAVKANEFALCSVVVYELRHGAERSANPAAEHAKLDAFVSPFVSLPFDDVCAVCCAKIRATLEGFGGPIGPHDLQIAAVALNHGLTLLTHNTREFGRIAGLKMEDWEL